MDRFIDIAPLILEQLAEHDGDGDRNITLAEIRAHLSQNPKAFEAVEGAQGDLQVDTLLSSAKLQHVICQALKTLELTDAERAELGSYSVELNPGERVNGCVPTVS